MAAPLCPGLTGAARTSCLNAQARADQDRTAKINQNNRNLDTAIGVAKAGQYAGSVAAGALGGMATTAATGSPAAGIVAGEAVSKGYGAATNAIANGKTCNASGNSGIAGSTPMRCN